jgi:DNA-binding SARP family transcriptional activator
LLTRIYLTGRVAVEHDGVVALDERSLPGRQGRLAFTYLAVNLARPVSKDELIDALWGDSPPREIDVTLSAVLSRLRALLKKNTLAAGIDVQQGSISLRIPSAVWVDIEAAVNAIDLAEGAARRRDWTEAWSSANVATVIARRPFLQADEAPWIEAERQRLRLILLRGLRCLSSVSAEAGELPVAVQYADQIVEMEPCHEAAYQHLMRLHVRMGNSAEALRAFAKCRARLRDELGASPSPETERLHVSILRGQYES